MQLIINLSNMSIQLNPSLLQSKQEAEDHGTPDNKYCRVVSDDDVFVEEIGPGAELCNAMGRTEEYRWCGS